MFANVRQTVNQIWMFDASNHLLCSSSSPLTVSDTTDTTDTDRADSIRAINSIHSIDYKSN